MIRLNVLMLALAATLMGQAAQAEAPGVSLRPVARASVTAAPGVLPRAVPEAQENEQLHLAAGRDGAPNPTTDATEKPRKGLFRALRPKQRTERVSIFASKKRRALEKGKVCGDTDLQGSKVGRVPGRIGGCGVENAIKLRSVSGIALSQQAVMDCGTAKALKQWVDRGLKPAVGNRGGGVSKIKVAAHYACRTRNNQKGARISEHGKGRAIDIAAFYLNDGSEISVLKHWHGGWRGKALGKMHKLACGPFGTVLGPNADRHHRDHFHFDTARYRSGSFCK